MIPFDELLKVIEDFNNKFKEVDKKCEDAIEAGDEYYEWYKMQKAYNKLQNVVEFKLRPFVEK